MATGGKVTFNFEGDTKDLDSKTEGLKSKFSNIGSTIGSAITKGATAAGLALGGMVVAGVKSYADLEQSIGGIETLYKDNADMMKKYANEAYKTAGLSANDYMETVTSFSASLLQSLGGDTKKAGEAANQAVIDMSDNANKFGTSMEAIQNAYQGFAKQNYTMLDNLKLGYGGTKSEMERLLSDAEKISGIKYDISNLNDVYSAIHVIQENLDVTGTTAKEASTTISGSFNSAKGAFTNFLAGTGDVNQVVETFTTLGKNVMNAVQKLAPQIINGVVDMVNQFIPMLPGIIETLLPVIMNGIMSLANGILAALPQIVTMLANMLPGILQTLADNLLVMLDSLADMLPTLIPVIVDGIIAILDVFNKNFDKFLIVGIKIILAIIEGLIKSIPSILKNLPTIIMAIINFFTVAKLVSAGRALLTGLGDGLIKGIPQLIKKAPEVLKYLINSFKSNGLGAFKSIGLDLVKGIGAGITNGFGWIKSTLKSFVGNVTSFVKKIFKIGSPSKLFANEIGQWLPKGIAVGINANTDSVTKAMDNINSDLLESSMFNLNPNMVGNMSNTFSPNVNVNVQNNMTTDPLGQVVSNIKTFSNGAKNDYNYGM